MVDTRTHALHARAVPTRREKFREYMVRFSPAADPAQAIRDGLYVPRPGRSMADEISGRIDLDPTSSHLVVGGIGSGKTTQLLVARDRLNEIPDVHARYVDVSLEHDITQMKAGVLTVVAGAALGADLSDVEDGVVRGAVEQFKKWERGYRTYHDNNDDGDDEDPSDYDWDPGYTVVDHAPLLSPPVVPALDPTVERAGSLLKDLCDAFVTHRQRHPVLLLDSLDRLSDIQAFVVVVEQDLRAIRQAGVGVVLAGPLRTMYGTHRSLVDQFTRFYPQPAVDVRTDPEGLDFMMRVLRRRASTDL